MITLPSHDLPIPPPTPSVWYLIKRLGEWGRLVDVQRVDVDAIRRKIEARRPYGGRGGDGKGA